MLEAMFRAVDGAFMLADDHQWYTLLVYVVLLPLLLAALAIVAGIEWLKALCATPPTTTEG